jgi:serine/threonine protein kinase
MSASTDHLIGTQVADYRIRSRLGSGGQGVVYVAEHVHLQKEVALKVPSRETTSDPAFGERFLREARTATDSSIAT